MGGKVLRLNDDGTVPDDNPFVDTPGHRPEIYAFGIRNANGLAFHPETGELWETENGPQGGDGVNIVRAGANYGWPVVSYGRAYTGDLTGTDSGPQQPQVWAEGDGGSVLRLESVDLAGRDDLLYGRAVFPTGGAI